MTQSSSPQGRCFRVSYAGKCPFLGLLGSHQQFPFMWAWVGVVLLVQRPSGRPPGCGTSPTWESPRLLRGSCSDLSLPFLLVSMRLLCIRGVTRIPACGILGRGSSTQIHTDHRVLWRKRDSAATLSRREHPDPCLDELLLLFWAHYIEDGPHLLCTGSL